jgi:hypothetical protein
MPTGGHCGAGCRNLSRTHGGSSLRSSDSSRLVERGGRSSGQSGRGCDEMRTITRLAKQCHNNGRNTRAPLLNTRKFEGGTNQSRGHGTCRIGGLSINSRSEQPLHPSQPLTPSSSSSSVLLHCPLPCLSPPPLLLPTAKGGRTETLGHRSRTNTGPR